MDRATRNETIRALAAASAAAIRMNPARALAAVSGEMVGAQESTPPPLPKFRRRARWTASLTATSGTART